MKKSQFSIAYTIFYFAAICSLFFPEYYQGWFSVVMIITQLVLTYNTYALFDRKQELSEQIKRLYAEIARLESKKCMVTTYE